MASIVNVNINININITSSGIIFVFVPTRRRLYRKSYNTFNVFSHLHVIPIRPSGVPLFSFVRPGL